MNETDDSMELEEIRLRRDMQKRRGLNQQGCQIDFSEPPCIPAEPSDEPCQQTCEQKFERASLYDNIQEAEYSEEEADEVMRELREQGLVEDDQAGVNKINRTEGGESPPTKDTNPKDAIGSRKASYNNVPVPVLYEIGAAMNEGACKYAAFNYRVAGVRPMVYIGAARRHIDDYVEGQDIDPGSGLHHITKAIASLVVLRDAQMNGMVKFDDRPPCAVEGWMERAHAENGQVLDRFPNPKAPYTEAELAHKRNTPVSIYGGQILGFELEVMLPAPPEHPEGFVWAQQGPRRTDLDHTLACVQALRDDGYGERVIRVTRVQDRVEQMEDCTEWISGELRTVVTTVFPGDPSLMEMTEEEAQEEAAEAAEKEEEGCLECDGTGVFSPTSDPADGWPCRACQEQDGLEELPEGTEES